MNKPSKGVTNRPRKPHLENEGKKRLTQMVALVAFGASVGLSAEVNAATPTAEVLKSTQKVDVEKVDVKDLKVKSTGDVRKVKVKPTTIKPVEKQMVPGGGSNRPPPP